MRPINIINFLTQVLRMTMLLMVNVLLATGLYVAYIYLTWLLEFKTALGL